MITMWRSVNQKRQAQFIAKPIHTELLKDSNAVFFYFQTQIPQKYYLKIAEKNLVPDMDYITEELRQCIELPDHGEVYLIEHKDVMLFFWSFDKKDCTPCSAATINDFACLHSEENKGLFKFDGPCPDATVSLPFFLSGKMDGIFYNEETLQLKQLFIYPTVSEARRVNDFMKSLVNNGYEVEKPDSSTRSQRFCQFTGGGDLFITKPFSPPMVFLAGTDGQPSDADPDEPDVSNTDGQPSDVDPGVSVEAKKESFPLEKLKYQLWANMFCAAVSQFIDKLLFTEQDISQLSKISGYGIGCTADGILGVYKLEIEFGKKN